MGGAMILVDYKGDICEAPYWDKEKFERWESSKLSVHTVILCNGHVKIVDIRLLKIAKKVESGDNQVINHQQ